MKKMTNARLRRTLAMIAALTILLSGLTGCKKKPADKEDPTASTPPTAATTLPTETTEAPKETEPKVPSVMGTVNTNNLNIRTSPSSTSTIISQLDAGERVEILEQRSSDGVNWGRIEKGWISLAYVTLDGQVTDNADSETKVEDSSSSQSSSNVSGSATNQTGTITATELNIRKGPGTDYDAVGKYKKGDKVTITETKDGWGKTDKGWVKLSYVNTTSSSTSTSTSTTTDSKNNTLVTNGSTTTLGTVKITIGALNVRYGPGSNYDVVTKVTNGNSYSYYQKSGDWVRINDGWIYTKGYTDIGGGTTGTPTNQTGTITASELNIRKGPGTSYESVGKYYNGNTVTITETKDGWGKTDKGWISMKYVSTSGTSTGTTTGTTATVTASSLYIRKEPSKTAAAVGGYTKGETITILETKDGWGRTNKGWVSMDYVKTN